ncbi:hypothetical protein UA08_06662 [Talaromyces atroroseus]|uniref:Cyanovirin-N domain-containing protein n=1 Tax=Talaromyces atroroseus TaxID=1441469 RepID=A0A225AWT6_TALAT|nr:hypothetical protein UA08_06662 [Talaromyces atroroseus]OKL57957.1 hypothetical protein UA08_06662 [Talaromyces atroroseus]
MKYITALSAILSAASAQVTVYPWWEFYCGSSCTDGTLIGSGTLDVNLTGCTDLGTTYDYCYFVSEKNTTMYRVDLSEKPDCWADANPVLYSGDCSSAGNWGWYGILYDA